MTFSSSINRVRCLVTGGQGFLGEHLVKSLTISGAHVTVLDRHGESITNPEGLSCVVGDIRDTALVNSLCARSDIIFHLSGLLGTHELFQNPRQAIDVNVNGALNVLLAAVSSESKPRVFLPTKPNGWNNIYSVTSQAIEKLGRSFREEYDLDVRILRIRNAYGPGQKWTPIRKFVPYCVAQALKHLPIEIYGDGSQRVDLIYATDLARLITSFMMLDRWTGESAESPTESSMTVAELASRILSLSKSKSRLSFVPMRSGEKQGDSGDELGESLPFVFAEDPLTPLSVGLSTTLDWCRSNL